LKKRSKKLLIVRLWPILLCSPDDQPEMLSGLLKLLEEFNTQLAEG
jgi:hypothetical protein